MFSQLAFSCYLVMKNTYHTQENKFSQFNYLESVAYREEFLEIPLIDIWIEKFKSILETRMKLKLQKIQKIKNHQL